MFRKTTALFVCLAFFTTSMYAGIGADKAVYRGGTIALEQGHEAKINLAGNALVYQTKQGAITIPYDQVESIEYGQKAGRRIGMAVAMTVLISPIGLLALASKKRNHMVTVSWKTPDGASEAAVFELGKDLVRPVLASLEKKSGKAIEYQTEDAKKNLGK